MSIIGQEIVHNRTKAAVISISEIQNDIQIWNIRS